MEKPHGIAIDEVMRKIYWTDYETLKIQRSNMDGSDVEDIVAYGMAVPYGMAIDTTSEPKMIYWVSG